MIQKEKKNKSLSVNVYFRTCCLYDFFSFQKTGGPMKFG